MRTVASVTMPNWPSEPIDQAHADRSRAHRDAAPPISIISPSISTIFRPSTLLVVTPYLRQCAPPEFMPMLPASVQASWLEGSGA